MADGASGMSHAEAIELAAGFVLGSLDPAEMARVREHLHTCSEAHAELEAMGAIVPALARSVPVTEAPASLGPRILAAARAELARAEKERDTVATAAAATAAGEAALRPAPVPVPVPIPVPPHPEPRRPAAISELFRRPAWGVATLAAVIAIAVLGVSTLQLQAQVADLAAYRDGVAAVLAAADTSGGQIAVIHDATGSGPTGVAAVDASGRLVLAMRNLAPTTGNQVYEAWLIGADGKPVPAGSFAVPASGTGTLTASISGSAPGVTVALTREAGPGATSPTLPIVASGQAHPANS
jgi:hypothetical protein